MKTVPRIGRLLDVVGLVLFLTGGAVFVRAWLGFQSVPDYAPALDGSGQSAIQFADGFWRLQKIGGGVMIAGIAVFVVAWWVAKVAARGVEEPG